MKFWDWVKIPAILMGFSLNILWMIFIIPIFPFSAEGETYIQRLLSAVSEAPGILVAFSVMFLASLAWFVKEAYEYSKWERR